MGLVCSICKTGPSLAATLHLTFFAVARKVLRKNLRLLWICALDFSVTVKKDLMRQCCSAGLFGALQSWAQNFTSSTPGLSWDVLMYPVLPMRLKVTSALE